MNANTLYNLRMKAVAWTAKDAQSVRRIQTKNDSGSH